MRDGHGAWSAVARPFEPLLGTLRSYDLRKLRQDAGAGLTLAVVEVPQAMAYAVVAGVPPHYGLYTSIVQGLLAALFTSSERLATGPTNTQSLLVAAVVSRVALEQSGTPDPELYLRLVFALTLLKGLLQLAFAAARMGTLLRYVSQSVVVGFTAGAGLLIAVGQLPSFLGLAPPGASGLPGVLGELRGVALRLGAVDPRAVAVGTGSLAMLLLVRRTRRATLAPLAALAAGALAVQLSGWDRTGLAVVGALSAQLPHLALPFRHFEEVELLLGGAFALATIGIIETVTIGKSLAAQTGERVRANQELLAQGVANFAGGLLQTLPGSGSFTRSALNLEAGAQSRFASVLGAGFVAASLWLLAPLAGSIPFASLAALLFAVAWRLIDVRFIVRVARTLPSDAAVCLTTLFAALLAPLQYAIFIGIFLNVALYLRKASRLHMTEMRSASGGAYEERPLRDVFGRERVLFLQIEGGLFFGLADELRDRLARVRRSGVQVVVLRLKRSQMVDATILLALEEFARAMQGEERHLLLCGLTREMHAAMERFGLVRLVGEENVFPAGPGVFSSAHRALARAREIVGTHVEAGEEEEEEEETGRGEGHELDPASASREGE